MFQSKMTNQTKYWEVPKHIDFDICITQESKCWAFMAILKCNGITILKYINIHRSKNHLLSFIPNFQMSI